MSHEAQPTKNVELFFSCCASIRCAASPHDHSSRSDVQEQSSGASRRSALAVGRRLSRAASQCLFCKIIAGQIPSQKLSETATTYAFLDIFPLSPGHALVIPKHCAEKLHEIPSAQLADVGAELSRVARAVVAATGTADYNVLQNNGEAAHQVVKHVHFHIIPKPDADRGLGVHWPSAKADSADLDALRAKITAELQQQDQQ